MIRWDRIDYTHFTLETKYDMEKKWIGFINPHDMSFYTSHHVYFALSFRNNDEIYVNMVQGTGQETNYIEGLRCFIKWSRMAGAKTIRFGTYSKNFKMLTFYRYIKAKYVKTVDNYYDDGDSYVEYLMNLEDSIRFIK